MTITKQKADTLEQHIRRIIPSTKSVTMRESSNRDISAITIVTDSGVLDIMRSQYGGEVDIFVSVPEKVFTAEFEAFGTKVKRTFKTEKDRDDFCDTVPDEQKVTLVKSQAEV